MPLFDMREKVEESMEELLRVGVVTTTHGVRGEVKVFPTTDDPTRFEELKDVILDLGREKRNLQITGVKYFKNLVILKFKGLDNVNDVEGFRQAEIYISREDAVPCEEDENYIADLLGMQVVTEDGMDLGILKEVFETGANDVYIVKSPEKEYMIPAIKDCVREVNLEENRMTIHVIPGLLDL